MPEAVIRMFPGCCPELAPQPSCKIVSALGQVIANENAGVAWPVEEQHRDQPKQFPSLGFRDWISRQLRSAPSPQCDTQTEAQTAPEEPGAQPQHGHPGCERFAEINLVHLLPTLGTDGGRNGASGFCSGNWAAMTGLPPLSTGALHKWSPSCMRLPAEPLWHWTVTASLASTAPKMNSWAMAAMWFAAETLGNPCRTIHSVNCSCDVIRHFRMTALKTFHPSLTAASTVVWPSVELQQFLHTS